MTVRVEPGDCLAVIPQLVAEGVVVDAVVTDPPYHLSEPPHVAGGGFGGSRSTERKVARAGFMSSRWDGGDIAFRPETWATVATILRPGGFLLAFGGTRTFHRLVCAIEDAGFVIQDTIAWLYGSGFPKRRDMLKPAFEPICVAYKPGGRRTLQVDECRISTSDGYADNAVTQGVNSNGSGYRVAKTKQQFSPSQNGRWPANVCHDGSAEVMEAFAAFGERSSGTMRPDTRRSNSQGLVYGKQSPIAAGATYGDAGSVSRYFYCAKADADDRWGSRHPTVKPVELLKWLVPLVTPKGGTMLDCFAGSGGAGAGALATGRNAILIEREAAYIADIRERLAHYEGAGRHSLAARNRNAKPRETLPLFDF